MELPILSSLLLIRMAQEPGRLAKRYLVHGLPFAARLLLTSAWRGVTA